MSLFKSKNKKTESRIPEVYAARSEIGLVRGHNEDNFIAASPLFVVADGMGGHEAGEVASAIAIEVMQTKVPTKPDAGALAQSVCDANMAVIEGAANGRGKPGMGTTVTAAAIFDNELIIAQVGDSRAYLLHNNTLQRITRDHSLVAEYVMQGRITEEEARYHPQRSVITRALGSDPNMRADTYSMNICQGDKLMLCSDGLYSMVEDNLIEQIMQSAPSAQECCDALIEAALAAGGLDNVTVIVVDPFASKDKEETAAQEADAQMTGGGKHSIASGAAAVVGVAAGAGDGVVGTAGADIDGVAGVASGAAGGTIGANGAGVNAANDAGTGNVGIVGAHTVTHSSNADNDARSTDSKIPATNNDKSSATEQSAAEITQTIPKIQSTSQSADQSQNGTAGINNTNTAVSTANAVDGANAADTASAAAVTNEIAGNATQNAEQNAQQLDVHQDQLETQQLDAQQGIQQGAKQAKKKKQKNTSKQDKPKKHIGKGPIIGVVCVVLVLAAAAFGIYSYAQNSYYLISENDKVVLYKGLPGEIGPLSLTWLEEKTDIDTSKLPANTASRLKEGISVSSKDEANSLLNTYKETIKEAQEAQQKAQEEAQKKQEEEAAKKAEEQKQQQEQQAQQAQQAPQ